MANESVSALANAMRFARGSNVGSLRKARRLGRGREAMRKYELMPQTRTLKQEKVVTSGRFATLHEIYSSAANRYNILPLE
jgi:hypothetical protein